MELHKLPLDTFFNTSDVFTSCLRPRIFLEIISILAEYFFGASTGRYITPIPLVTESRRTKPPSRPYVTTDQDACVRPDKTTFADRVIRAFKFLARRNFTRRGSRVSADRAKVA